MWLALQASQGSLMSPVLSHMGAFAERHEQHRRWVADCSVSQRFPRKIIQKLDSSQGNAGAANLQITESFKQHLAHSSACHKRIQVARATRMTTVLPRLKRSIGRRLLSWESRRNRNERIRTRTSRRKGRQRHLTYYGTFIALPLLFCAKFCHRAKGPDCL